MRIFVIGLPKTGLSSMTKALEDLGFSRHHHVNPKDLLEYWRNPEMDVPDNHFVCDLGPRNFWYNHMRYPDAKFILTTRDLDSWVDSVERHFIKEKPVVGCKGKLQRVSSVGLFGFNREYLLEYHKRHLEQVRDYFRPQRDNLLEFNLGTSDYGDLCQFLDISCIPEGG